MNLPTKIFGLQPKAALHNIHQQRGGLPFYRLTALKTDKIYTELSSDNYPTRTWKQTYQHLCARDQLAPRTPLLSI